MTRQSLRRAARCTQRYVRHAFHWLDARLDRAARSQPAPHDPRPAQATETGTTTQRTPAEPIGHDPTAAAAPYGLRASAVTVHHRDGGEQIPRLVADPPRDSVVGQIFFWRAVSGLTIPLITHRLNANPRRYPLPTTAAGAPAPWTTTAVSEILRDFTYTGYHVGNTRDEQGQARRVEQWVISEQPVHRALVSVPVFWAAQDPSDESVRAWRCHMLGAQRRGRSA